MNAPISGRDNQALTEFQQQPSVPASRPGRLGRVLLQLFTKQATVVAVNQVDERFYLITLQSPAFRDVQWVAGQKLQILMHSAFVARTFTPIEWDRAEGRTRILLYTHGDSPAGDWVRELRAGTECHVFGPRPSLDLSKVPGPLVVLGDETSIGLAYSTYQQDPARAVCCLLEVNAVANTRALLARLALGSAGLFERRTDDAHLHDLESCLPALVATAATFVLTGKAASVQRLRRVLKTLGTPANRLLTKPYWAPGKAGLD